MDDDDDDSHNTGSMYKIPYGLCSNEGIDTEGMTPTEAWEAYQAKTGIGHDDVLKTLQDKDKALKKKLKSTEKSVANYKKKIQEADPNSSIKHSAAYKYTKSTKKQLKDAQKEYDYYKSQAEYMAASVDKLEAEGLEEYKKNNPWTVVKTEEDFQVKMKWYHSQAKYYGNKAAKSAEDVAVLKKMLEPAENLKKLEKAFSKKELELQHLKYDKVHVSEETKAKGQKAKTDYLDRKKTEWKQKVDAKFEEVQKIDSTAYAGIWKDKVVKPSDYLNYKDSIASKRAYFEGILNSDTLTPSNKHWAEMKLGQLEHFEKQGKAYVRASREYAKVQASASKWGIRNCYELEKRSKSVPWKTEAEYDAAMRDYTGAIWNEASFAEKVSAHNYTGSYSQYNEPLRGVEYGSSKFVGVENINWEHIGEQNGKAQGYVKTLITNFTSIIDKTSSPVDTWLQRGVGFSGASKFLNVSKEFLASATTEELQSLVGTTPRELGFCSTSGAKGGGFSHHPVIFNIFAPSGTKMLYVEPFSQYGEGTKTIHWNGVSKQKIFSQEFETVMQQGTQFQVTRAFRSNSSDVVYFDLMVIDQSPNYIS
jgi:hypothetical protein